MTPTKNFSTSFLLGLCSKCKHKQGAKEIELKTLRFLEIKKIAAKRFARENKSASRGEEKVVDAGKFPASNFKDESET